MLFQGWGGMGWIKLRNWAKHHPPSPSDAALPPASRLSLLWPVAPLDLSYSQTVNQVNSLVPSVLSWGHLIPEMRKVMDTPLYGCYVTCSQLSHRWAVSFGKHAYFNYEVIAFWALCQYLLKAWIFLREIIACREMNFTTSAPVVLANVSFTLRVTMTWSYITEGKGRSRKR